MSSHVRTQASSSANSVEIRWLRHDSRNDPGRSRPDQHQPHPSCPGVDVDGLRHERRHRHACLHRDQYRRDLTLPDGIAITPNGATAYVTDPYDKTVTPIDTATDTPGTPITLTGSPSDSPLAIAITPNGATAYVTSGNTLLWPIDLATNRAGTPITLE